MEKYFKLLEFPCIMSNQLKQKVQKILDLVDVKIDGNRPWDIKVHNSKFYRKVLASGSMGLGESYMDGWWDCDKLDQFFTKILEVKLDWSVKSLSLVWEGIKANALNLQSKARAFQVGEKHYDIGNDLYSLMLDKRLVYSCGYWKKAKNLDQAQEAKLDLVCRKIGLKKGDKVLDIGCGWGSFAKFAAEKYKAKVVGITISKEQVKLAKERCKGLPVEIRLEDYRNLNEKFDHIISLGMFEHVGVKNYRGYMKIVNKNLKDDGLFLLQTIGRNNNVKCDDPWTNKYIFPNGTLPSPKQITRASEGLFTLEDWHSLRHDYDKTLMAWVNNFKRNWGKLKGKYDERFRRMWIYYLMIFAAGFRSNKYQLWQIVFSKNGVKGGYNRVN